ncbi:sulfatase [Bacteroidales bacterium]|nr:sulfatase [Bacteroidales bacterium]
MMKYILTIILLSSTLGGFAIDPSPNILFIMTDDHSAQAVGAYDGFYSELNPTPNIDKLAAEGMLFENAFCVNSICTPSRASVLTGQYPQTSGVLDFDQALPTDKQYLPAELKKLGYSTAIIGKWHLHAEPGAFDFYKVLPGQGKYFDPMFMEKGKGQWPNNKVKEQGHSTDVITDASISYLKGRDKSKPFFLMHHFKAPHGKWEYAPRYEDFLSNIKIPEPESMYAQPHFGSALTNSKIDSIRSIVGTSISARHSKTNYVEAYAGESGLKGDDATSFAYQVYLKKYLRCVKGVDDNIGRLFDYLKKEGLWENTIIVYTSDQGFMLGAHDLIDKRWMYDESMRMPFIVHYPKMIEKGLKSDIIINTTDFAPTLLDMAGGNIPSYMQGHSFTRTLNGKVEKNWRTSTYYRYWLHMIHHYVPSHFGIRTKDYKLMFFYSKHYLPEEKWTHFNWHKRYSEVLKLDLPVAWEFYDLKNDPQELVNQYNNPEYANVITRLKKELKEKQEKLNETDANYPSLKNIIEDNWSK